MTQDLIIRIGDALTVIQAIREYSSLNPHPSIEHVGHLTPKKVKGNTNLNMYMFKDNKESTGIVNQCSRYSGRFDALV